MCDFMVSDLNLIQAIYECMEAQAHWIIAFSSAGPRCRNRRRACCSWMKIKHLRIECEINKNAIFICCQLETIFGQVNSTLLQAPRLMLWVECKKKESLRWKDYWRRWHAARSPPCISHPLPRAGGKTLSECRPPELVLHSRLEIHLIASRIQHINANEKSVIGHRDVMTTDVRMWHKTQYQYNNH